MTFAERLVAAWYAPRLTPLTLPLAAAVGAVRRRGRAAARALSRRRAARARLPVPVVVIGNITVGGSGKTPLVAALASALAARGWRPGIVSRGYGRRTARPAMRRCWSRAIDPALAGDEPVLLARAGFPVAVAARSGGRGIARCWRRIPSAT